MAVQALGHLPPYFTIGKLEREFVDTALTTRLSGYIGGNHTAGIWIERLENKWAEKFNMPHAVACNSATSGLLMACWAAGIEYGDEVWVTSYSMSATAAAPKVLGAKLRFIDIEDYYYGLNWMKLKTTAKRPKALIVTNLFGYPAALHEIRRWCDAHEVIMIEDNAQAPLAKCRGMYAGTVGHMGVFSLNVHKHIQCGEGGVVVTADTLLAGRLRDFMNHGELHDRAHIGLNLRMTEPVAAIACAQLYRADELVSSRIDIALRLSAACIGVPWLYPPMGEADCQHVYYLWCPQAKTREKAVAFRDKLQAYKFPIRLGYTTPLTVVFDDTRGECPLVEQVNDRLLVYENCLYDPTGPQVSQMFDILRKCIDMVGP